MSQTPSFRRLITAATLEAPEEKLTRRGRTDAEASADDDGITELEKFEPERVDGVTTPANGFPVLMMKGVPDEQAGTGDSEARHRKGAEGPGRDEAAKSDGDPDEDEDEPGGDSDDGDAQGAREGYDSARKEWMGREPVAKDALTGTEFLQQQAAWRRWYTEGDEAGLNGTSDGFGRWTAKRAAAAPAGQAVNEDAPELDEALAKAEAAVYKRDINTAARRKLAQQGHALPDGSYPIANNEDLHSAAVLARSGHGNAAGAKRLIARRAKELGVANPLDSDSKDATSKAAPAKPMAGKKPPCPTCDGSGKIKDGNLRCPDCKGRGRMKSGAAKAEAALLAVQDTVAKHLAAGVISQEAADAILAEAVKASGRALPAGVEPAAAHREPDGTSTVEQLEPDAGMATDPDRTPDKVAPSVSAMGKQAPYTVARMHDATCAAYAADDVLAEYPALKSITDAIDPAWWRSLAAEAAAAGETAGSAGFGALGDAADLVKDADTAAVADGRAYLHKSFTDMYPSEHCSPSDPKAPGRFQRPYLSAGHASADASHKGSASIPPSQHVPEPEDYQRPPITAGHEAPSPANTPGNNRVGPGSPAAARSYYTNSARDQARTALAAMHDHIAGSFPDLCPMAASKTVLPPDMGAQNVPQPVTPQPQGALKEGAEARAVPVSGELVSLTAANHAVSEKVLRKMIRKALREMPPAPASLAPPLDTEALRTVMSEQIALLTEKYDTQLAELRKELGELGSQPDPALAPLRGALARPSGTAVPVERRSLVDEAQADAVRKEAGERVAYRQYVEALSHSPDPGTREKALAVIEKMSAAAA